MKSFALFLLLFFFGKSMEAQVLGPTETRLKASDDGLIPKSEIHSSEAREVPYPHLRQDDMLWSKRHWERIYTLEKLNHPLYYPIKALADRKSLFDVIKDGILSEGFITDVYDDDEFKRPLTMSEVNARIFSYDTIRDKDDRDKILTIDTTTIKANNVVAWDIKSDWYFDKQRGELKNRIIGISPVIADPKNEKNLVNLFWVWFPGARPVLATNVAYNPNNNTKRLTFDQIFQMRYFSSVITQEDNVYDRTIDEYLKNRPMEQLLESKRIREDLRNREHDYWQF